MKKNLSAAAIFMLFSVIPVAEACSFIYCTTEYARRVDDFKVVNDKDELFKYFISANAELLPPAVRFNKGVSTLEAERQDITKAIQERMPSISEEKRLEIVENYMNSSDVRRETMCDGKACPQLPEELAEFQLYIEGLNSIHGKAPEKIPEAWEKLLALPEKKRHYRTVWVHFMLGNIFKDKQHIHYDDCRKAVKDGFADTAGLAYRSYLLEVRFRFTRVRTIHNMVAAELGGIEAYSEMKDRWHLLDKLPDGEYFALVNDPLCRELMAIFVNTGRFRKMVKGFKLKNADYCAFNAYTAGNMYEAEEFLKLLPAETLVSTWLEAKIARMKGNLTLAAVKFKKWLALAEKAKIKNFNEQWRVVFNDFSHPLASDVYGQLGAVLILRRDFVEAMEFLCRGDLTDDAIYVAERILTLKELSDFVRKRLPEAAASEKLAGHVRYSAGRRAFRERDFAAAAEFLPAEEQKYLKQYLDFVKKSKDESAGADERALALYNAAKIMRHRGMELSGTWDAPDYFCTGGAMGSLESYTRCKLCSYNMNTGYWKLCEGHTEKSNEIPGFNAVPQQMNESRRFHYRHAAGMMALEAADMAENKELKALINYFGGKIFEIRSPQEANIFYKRLVRQSPDVMLSQLAAKRRWIPKVAPLTVEVSSVEPLKDLAAVRELMKKAFPGAEE